MTSTLHSEPVAGLLADLYSRAATARAARPRASRSGAPEQGLTSDQAQARADALEDQYMPIGEETGLLTYQLIRAARPAQVVEFGTSYGVSTLYLAAAVHDNGTGHVHTTEMNAKKIAAARATFADAGLDDLVTVHEGDAVTTLAELAGPIGFVLLDGWKPMYRPLLDVLEPKLAPGALLLADNTSLAGLDDYLAYVRDPANGYAGVSLPGKGEDTVELSVRL